MLENLSRSKITVKMRWDLSESRDDIEIMRIRNIGNDWVLAGVWPTKVAGVWPIKIAGV